MRDSARDRPSRNACDDTFSTIGKGPRKQWSSFFDGRVVRMFHESSQTVSTTLNGGIGRRRDAEWTSYCLRAQDIWSRRYIWSSLRSVATWRAVSDTTGSRDTSSFRWKPLLVKKGVTMVVECDVLLYANSAKGRRLTQSSCW